MLSQQTHKWQCKRKIQRQYQYINCLGALKHWDDHLLKLQDQKHYIVFIPNIKMMSLLIHFKLFSFVLFCFAMLPCIQQVTKFLNCEPHFKLFLLFGQFSCYLPKQCLKMVSHVQCLIVFYKMVMLIFSQ